MTAADSVAHGGRWHQADLLAKLEKKPADRSMGVGQREWVALHDAALWPRRT
jgi:hypothetical protein